MKNKYRFTILLLFTVAVCASLLTGIYVRGQKKDSARQFTVVTSFYPMYIAAENIIGDCERVNLQNLSEPQTGCLHDFQLTPEDMKLLSGADIFIVNGGGIESFLSDVAEQYPELTIINAAEDMELIEDNAHAWMSIPGYREQIAAITEGLCRADESDAGLFEKNAAEYDEKLAALEAQQKTIRDAAAKASVISFHEAYEYVAEDYGLKVSYTLNLDEERQVSAGEVAEVVSAIRENGIDIVLAEELYGSDMAATVTEETGVKVYYLDTLVRGDYDKDSYINGMQENINILKKAFGVN